MKLDLEVVDILSLDVDNLRGWRPASSEDVYLAVELEIGEAGVPGAHVFQLMVSTPEGVRAHHKGKALQAFTAMRKRGKTFDIDAMIVLDPYDWHSLHDMLLKRVTSCERSTWAESLDCLRTKFFWEGIDYR
jgi:hypothetical protein